MVAGGALQRGDARQDLVGQHAPHLEGHPRQEEEPAASDHEAEAGGRPDGVEEDVAPRGQHGLLADGGVHGAVAPAEEILDRGAWPTGRAGTPPRRPSPRPRRKGRPRSAPGRRSRPRCRPGRRFRSARPRAWRVRRRRRPGASRPPPPAPVRRRCRPSSCPPALPCGSLHRWPGFRRSWGCVHVWSLELIGGPINRLIFFLSFRREPESSGFPDAGSGPA